MESGSLLHGSSSWTLQAHETAEACTGLCSEVVQGFFEMGWTCLFWQLHYIRQVLSISRGQGRVQTAGFPSSVALVGASQYCLLFMSSLGQLWRINMSGLSQYSWQLALLAAQPIASARSTSMQRDCLSRVSSVMSEVQERRCTYAYTYS